MPKRIRTAADLPAVLDCGHAPQPSFWADGSTYTVPDTGEVLDMTGRVIFPGWATVPDGRNVCPDCADDMQRAEMATAKRVVAYLASDNRSVTSWTGGKLGTVTRVTSNRRQTFVRVTDTHGGHWAGIGPAESGTYVSLRRVKS